MKGSQPTDGARRALTLGLLGVAVLGTSCASRNLRPANADGTYCYRIGRGLQRAVTCTPVRIPTQAVEDDAKRFEPAPDRLTLYVVRNRWADGRGLVRFTIGSRVGVDMVPVSLARWRLPAGPHRITATWSEGSTSLEVSGNAGDIRFVELVGGTWSWGTSYRLEQGDPVGSRNRAARLRLVGDQD